MSDITNIRVPSPAKLNLFLHICGQREDGYHELQTVFQFIDYCDYLTFNLNQSDQITISGMNLPLADNLIYRAAMCLKPKGLGAHIQIEKLLPQGGGIGGGSSNAATTLLTLNKLWQCGLTQDELRALGRQLGADIPIFIFGKNAWAEGIGEKLTAIDTQKKVFLLHQPNCHVSTKEIFSHSLLTRDSKKKRIAAFLDQRQAEDFHNDFELLVRKLYPEIDHAFNALSEYGKVRMTGTGSCVFLTFDNDSQAQKVALQLQPDINTIIAKGVNRSPAINALYEAGF